MITDKCTKISPAGPYLMPPFLNHLTGFVEKKMPVLRAFQSFFVFIKKKQFFRLF